MSQQSRMLFTADAQLAVSKPEGTDGPGTLTGYALVWNVLSKDRGGFHVKLMPGSAKFENPTQALFHHNGSAVIGSTDNESLRIAPDDFGVKVEIDLPNTTVGRDVAELVGKKYIRGMSFEMRRDPEGRRIMENGKRVFAASRYDVKEVTVTGNPAFVETTVGMKFSDNPDEVAAAVLRLNQLKLNFLRLPADVRHRRTV